MHPRAPTRIFAPLFPIKKKKKSPRALGKWGCPFAGRRRAAEIPGKWSVPEPQRVANLPARPPRTQGQVPRAQSSKMGTDAAAAACMVLPSAPSLETLSSSCRIRWSDPPRPAPPGSPGPPPPSPGRCCGGRGAAASAAVLPQCCIVLPGSFRWRGEPASAALGGWL